MFTEVIIALVAVALVQAFLVKPFGVPSQSMEQTLHIGDRILVNRLDDDIARGDVVVFGHGNTWQEKQLPPASQRRHAGPSRVRRPHRHRAEQHGLHGQAGHRPARAEVACCSTDGKVTVDGQPLDEPYIYEDLPFTAGTLDCSSSPRSTRCFPEITVPRENLIVLGDHRSESADSVIGCRGATDGPECARFVPKERVVGPVVLRFWPLGDIGPLPH